MTTPKEIIFAEDARGKLKAGIDKLADLAAISLGPKGHNVGLGSLVGSPTITNDGNTIMKEVELKDQFENMGVSLGQGVVEKIKDVCGDGTTTGIVIYRDLIRNGLKNIAAGSSPMRIKKGMEKALSSILKHLDAHAEKISDASQTAAIATVSASGDKNIGNIIADSFAKAGKEGVITIEESKTTETHIELVEGMALDRGYISPYFCTNAEKMTAELTNPKILITDKKMSTIQDILSIVQNTAASGAEMLIIADDIEGEVLSTLVINKLRGTIKIAAIKAPGFGDNRKAMLEDIAILTGGTFITEDADYNLKDIQNSHLGMAEKIIITKDKTTIINGHGEKVALEKRIKQLEEQKKQSESSYDQEKLQERKAKLQGGVAIIKVGAATEAALKQKKQMFEDSLNSTRAALEEGIVIGGGIALLRAAEAAKELKLEGEEKIGVDILVQACQSPCRQIITNSGHEAGVILEDIMKRPQNFGFNVFSETVVDLKEAQIADPNKVVKTALTHAVSGAGIVWLSEILIGDAKEKKNEE